MEIGLIQNTNSEYHGGEGISSSFLREIHKSLLHALNREETAPSPALEFGSACHKWILEEDDFQSEFIVFNFDKRTKEGKMRWQEAQDENLVVITESQFQQIQAMKDALVPEAMDLLKGALVEQSVYWERDNVLCKCRPDAMFLEDKKDFSNKPKAILVDYKTTADASPKGFEKSVRNFGYHQQASWYIDGIVGLGYEVTDFYFIAQEKTFPYANKVYRLGDKSIFLGSELNTQAFDIYKEYLQNKQISCYNSPNVMEINLYEAI